MCVRVRACVCVCMHACMRKAKQHRLDRVAADLLKSVRVHVHFAPGKIAITLELLGQFIRFLDQNDRRSLGVLLIY